MRVYVTMAVALTVTACSIGPDYARPDVKPPEAHRGQAQTAESLADLPWWKVFHDPVLGGYVKEALEKGFDVRVAAANVESARAGQRGAFWAFFPSFGGQVGVGGGQGFPGVPTFVPPTTANGLFAASASASWEADVWGRLRRQKESADALVDASLADQRGVYVALVGDVASTYLQLRTYDLQRTLVDDALKTRAETLALFQERAKGGVGNDLEVARAEANLADAQAQAEGLTRAIWVTENRLALLLARPPGPLERGAELTALQLPPQVPAGLPTALLAQRPDVVAAEQQLHAATAQVGVKVGELFPKFALAGSAGVALGPDLVTSATLVSPVYRGSVGLEYVFPVLGGAQNLAAVDAAWARVHAATALYEKTATNALREVSDALVTIDQSAKVRAAREQQVASLQRTEALAMMRYRGGVSNYLEVVTAQEQRLGAELALADAKGQQHQAVVALYRALGGGWRTAAAQAGEGVPADAPEGPPAPPGADAGR